MKRNKTRRVVKRVLKAARVISPHSMKAREAAHEAGIGEGAFYELLKRDAVPNIRVGRRYVIPRAAFMKWLESCGGKLAS